MGAELWKRESREPSFVLKGRKRRLILEVGRGRGACEVSLGWGAITREEGNEGKEWSGAGEEGKGKWSEAKEEEAGEARV